MTLGGLTLSNPAALWGLLALPALAAVHFLQQRARRLETSTRFLIDALAPESSGGRTWDRFIASRSFWLQVLASLLCVWVWTAPRWPRADSRQVVAIVLDDSISMQASEANARDAARRLMDEAQGRATATEWVVMGSDPRAPALYRGDLRARAESALREWRPRLGTHDPSEALASARTLAGVGGASWFVTDRESKVPADQPAVGVGRALANVGFAGGLVERAPDGAWRWRAVIRNSSAEPQRRSWWVETAAGAGERHLAELAPDAVLELAGTWPAGEARGTLRMESDGFGADDVLPLVRPEWKRLAAKVDAPAETGEFFKRLLGGIDGVVVAGAGDSVGLRIGEEAGAEVPAAGAAVILAKTGSMKEKGLLRAPVVAERHALVDGLNWQGLLGPGPATLAMSEKDEGLLWQNDAPLAWLRPGSVGRRQLVLNIDWASGNAGRLPASVLLVRRQVEAVRDALPGSYSANFDAGGHVALADADMSATPAGAEWFIQTAEGARRVIPIAELAVMRAPAEAGFFTVARGEDILVRGAAQFADARQGDFRDAGEFRREAPAGESEAAGARNTQDDPLAPAWIALAGGAILWSWAPTGKRAKGGRA